MNRQAFEDAAKKYNARYDNTVYCDLSRKGLQSEYIYGMSEAEHIEFMNLIIDAAFALCGAKEHRVVNPLAQVYAMADEYGIAGDLDSYLARYL